MVMSSASVGEKQTMTHLTSCPLLPASWTNVDLAVLFPMQHCAWNTDTDAHDLEVIREEAGKIRDKM